MKKWEETNRLKTYQKKVLTAKSTINKKSSNKSIELRSPSLTMKSPGDTHYGYSPHRLDSAGSMRTSTSGISDYFDTEKEDLTQIPLYKLLKYYSLQQYAKV